MLWPLVLEPCTEEAAAATEVGLLGCSVRRPGLAGGWQETGWDAVVPRVPPWTPSPTPHRRFGDDQVTVVVDSSSGPGPWGQGRPKAQSVRSLGPSLLRGVSGPTPHGALLRISC